MIIKEKTIKVADNRKLWLSMWRNENGQYCIGRIGFGGMRIAWRKGQKSYIERMWSNYKWAWIGYYGCRLPVWFGYSILVDIMSDTRRFSATELMRLNTPAIEESTEYQDYVDYESLLDEMYSHYLAQANAELLQIDVSCWYQTT